MHFSTIAVLLVSAATIQAASHKYKISHKPERHRHHSSARSEPLVEGRAQTKSSRYLTAQSSKYVVDGSALPDVDFNVGESYAGLMPIGGINDTKETDPSFYFWFFPSENATVTDEIVIYLNGGTFNPGCSSLQGLMQGNGPFLWQAGTFKPVRNPYSWTKLSNVVWIEQPIGTGFTHGVPTAQDNEDVAEQFLGFWKNFVDTFNLKNRRVFIAGEAYAGSFISYIANAMLDRKNTHYFNLEATLMYNPSITYNSIQTDIQLVPYTDYYSVLFPFNDTFKAQLHKQAKDCGYDAYVKKYLTYPATKGAPTAPPGFDETGAALPECDTYEPIKSAIRALNPCFNMFHITKTCPRLWDVLGTSGIDLYQPDGANYYFNRTDVQKAINAPDMEWLACTNADVYVDGLDFSTPSILGPLPKVIERSKRTIIGQGALDLVTSINGTLLAIQNMTWSNVQGFNVRPTEPFYVPYHSQLSPATQGGAGVMGKTHTERGLTFVSVDLAGQAVPQYAPAAAYRHLEYLLGRISSLTSKVPFTTPPSLHK